MTKRQKQKQEQKLDTRLKHSGMTETKAMDSRLRGNDKGWIPD
jgi:hypothetical protein